jgi:hypothetical protein
VHHSWFASIIKAMYTYKIYPERNLIVIRFEGEIDFSEMMELHHDMINDPEYHKNLDGVADQRTATLQLTTKEISKIARFNLDHDLVSGRWAHIIITPIETALAKTYQRKALDQHGMHIFYNIETASAYLGYDISPYLLD